MHPLPTHAFRFELRIVACQNCGAPIESVPAGGRATCTYCQASHEVTPRRDDPFEPVVATMSEAERVATLRRQDGRSRVLPASLQPLVEGGRLTPWKEQEAIAVWRSTCEELRRGDNFEAAERLLVLTMLLSGHFGGKREALRQRALFESASDLFRLPRHR